MNPQSSDERSLLEAIISYNPSLSTEEHRRATHHQRGFVIIAEIQSTITSNKDEIRRRYRAEIKGIFGSYARDDLHADSDLNLLVDFDEGADLFDLVGLQQFLEEKLECKVDLVSRRSLRKELHTSILNEMINL